MSQEDVVFVPTLFAPAGRVIQVGPDAVQRLGSEVRMHPLMQLTDGHPVVWAKDYILLTHTGEGTCCAFVAVRGEPVAETTRALCGGMKQGDSWARLVGDTVCARCGAELLRMARMSQGSAG